MTHYPIISVGLLLGAFVLTACARSTNPGEAGFIDGLANQTDGTYDRQIETKREQRSGLEEANALLLGENKRLAVIEQENARELGAARGQLSSLQSQVRQLRSAYNANQARYAQELKALNRVERSLKSEKVVLASATRSDTGAGSASLSRLRKLQQTVAALPKE